MLIVRGHLEFSHQVLNVKISYLPPSLWYKQIVKGLLRMKSENIEKEMASQQQTQSEKTM